MNTNRENQKIITEIKDGQDFEGQLMFAIENNNLTIIEKGEQ